MWSHLTQVRELDIFKVTVSQTVHGRDAFWRLVKHHLLEKKRHKYYNTGGYWITNISCIHSYCWVSKWKKRESDLEWESWFATVLGLCWILTTSKKKKGFKFCWNEGSQNQFILNSAQWLYCSTNYYCTQICLLLPLAWQLSLIQDSSTINVTVKPDPLYGLLTNGHLLLSGTMFGHTN